MNVPPVPELYLHHYLHVAVRAMPQEGKTTNDCNIPVSMPAGSVVMIDGDYKHYDAESDNIGKAIPARVTVVEYIRLNNHDYVMVGKTQAVVREYFPEMKKTVQEVVAFFNPALVSEIISVGSGIKTRVKSESQHKREVWKAERPFPTAFFTPGTRIRVERDSIFDNVTEFTVKQITYNGPDSVLLVTTSIRKEGYFAGEQESFVKSYVTEILEHKPGVPEMAPDKRPKTWKFASDRFGAGGIRWAGKGEYASFGEEIVRHAIAQWLPHVDGVCYDMDKLHDLLVDRGLFRQVGGGEMWYGLTVVNKKKLKRAVLQLQGKVSVSARKRQEEDDEESNRMTEQDMRHWVD